WLLLFSILFGHKGGQEDAGSSLLQRERLWCGEEGRGALRCPSSSGNCLKEEESDEKTIFPGILKRRWRPSLGLQSFCGSFWKQVRDSHASLPCLYKRHRLGLLRPLKEGEGPMKPEAQRFRRRKITLKFLLFMSLVNLRWTLLETSSSSNIKWRTGVESGSPNGSHSIRFFFICKDQSASIIGDEHVSNNTFNVRTENLSSGQIKVICICKMVESSWGQPYSPESNQLVFSVVGVPDSPLLKVDPLTQRVKEGDPMIFLCSMEGGDPEKKFHFYKDGLEMTSSKEADMPPPPVLKLDPLSQRVKEGDCLFLLCLAEGSITEKKFHFYKDGVEITSSQECLPKNSSEPEDLLQSGSLRILCDNSTHNGEFACSYEEKRSNRWIMSSLSQGTNITVDPVLTQDSDPIWRYSLTVIPLIILLVPFAFYCWRKKSTSVSQEQLQLREKKEERNDLPVMEPQAATADTSSPVKDSEVTYSCIQNFLTPSPAGPTRKKSLTQREERILYSDIRGQEDGDRELLQRGRLWCGEEGQGAGLGWGNDAVPALPLELEG
ncbi:hypothetical protein E2320_003705, partial [Naja naja]